MKYKLEKSYLKWFVTFKIDIKSGKEVNKNISKQ